MSCPYSEHPPHKPVQNICLNEACGRRWISCPGAFGADQLTKDGDCKGCNGRYWKAEELGLPDDYLAALAKL